MSERFLNEIEQQRVGRLIGEAITKLCDALAIIRQAEERTVTGVNITIQYHLKEAVKEANKASNQITA